MPETRYLCSSAVVQALFLALTLPAAGPADALAGIKYTVKPVLGLSTTWESNYFREELDETAVYTYLLQPGVAFSFQAAKTRIELHATLDGNAYTTTSETLDNFFGYTLGCDLSRSTRSRKLTFGLQDNLAYSRNPELLEDLEKLTSRELYLVNTLRPYLSYNIGRLRTSLSYENTITRYDEEGTEDASSHRGGLDLQYQPNRTYSFGPKFSLESTGYDDAEAEGYEGMALSAVLLRQSKFLSLSGSIGYRTREVDGPEGSELNEMTWDLAVSSSAGFKKTSFSFSLQRNLNNTLQHEEEAYHAVLQFNGSVQRKIRISKDLSMGLSASYTWNTSEQNNNAQDDHEQLDQQDTIWSTEMALDYILTRWLNLQFSTRYEERDSAEGEDYENSSCMLKFSYIY